MKKKIMFGLAVAFLFFVLALNIISLYAAGIPEDPIGGGSLYIREDLPCPGDPPREKTLCTVGGYQLCDPKYCN